MVGHEITRETNHQYRTPVTTLHTHLCPTWVKKGHKWEIRDKIDYENVPDWVQDKISKMTENIRALRDFYNVDSEHVPSNHIDKF